MDDLNRKVQDLGVEFWDWRVINGYRSPDDIPRLELMPDWVPQFDQDSARRRLERVADFRRAMGGSRRLGRSGSDHRLTTG